MIVDNIKKLIIGIAIVSLLIVMCMAMDSASEVEINNHNDSKTIIPKGVIVVNDSIKDKQEIIVPKKTDKVHTEKVAKKHKPKKRKLPTISMWAKPSVRCGYPYKWYYRTFIDYCPNCHHYNCLLKNPKKVPENEYTCSVCESDFDGVVGKEKYAWSHVYLRKA